MKKVIRLTENDIHNIVKEAVKRAINEEWYPENETDIDDYYYGAIFKFETDLVYFDEDEQIPEDFLNIKDEYIESENTYVSVMVTNIEPEIDETDGSASFIIRAAISAPNMPLDKIEEETTNTVWVWLDNKLNKRFSRVWIVDEKEVYDRRSIKESILREGYNNQPEYSHYAVNKATNKIVYSWAYGDIDGSELRQFKRDYFIVDLTDNDLDPKQYKILGKAALMRQGIDPDDDSNWANS